MPPTAYFAEAPSLSPLANGARMLGRPTAWKTARALLVDCVREASAGAGQAFSVSVKPQCPPDFQKRRLQPRDCLMVIDILMGLGVLISWRFSGGIFTKQPKMMDMEGPGALVLKRNQAQHHPRTGGLLPFLCPNPPGPGPSNAP